MMKLSFAGDTIAEINGSILAYAASLSGWQAATAVGNAPAKPSPPVTAPTLPSATAISGTVSSTDTAASTAAGDTDAAGFPWDPAKHAGTKAKVASGLWRMKVGVKRLPGEGEDSPFYIAPGADVPVASSSASAAPSGSVLASPPSPPAPPAPPKPPVDPNRPESPNFRHDNGDGTEQWYVGEAWDGGTHPIPGDVLELGADDEFAAFRAAATTGAVDRTWTDADLSQLLNQAAQKVGDVTQVKGVIAKYATPGGQGHSREIPIEKREAFAREVESTFGIQYAAG